jgi:DNA-binding CsgD family transcriptional regulator/tetratricopeptide (TPR) repeat protein
MDAAAGSVWQTAATNPERALPAAATPLVGRDTELSAVTELLDAAADGSPRIIVLGGDAGVGKTRFTRQIATGAAKDGWTVLRGSCVELAEGATVLAPVTEVLRQLARDRGDAAVARLLEGPARWLGRLVPELGADVLDSDQAPASQMLASFHRLLRDLAEDAPVLLVIEDLHWADTGTRDLLVHLASRLHDERLAVLATVRTDDLGRRHPLRPVLAEAVRRPEVDRIDLAPLDDAAVTMHLTALLGDDIDPERLAAITARAQGNPFYAEELVAAGDGRLPPSLEDVLLLRIERLPGDTQQLLGEAAVLGVTVDATLLESVTRLDASAISPAVRAALDDGILVADRRGYAFRHALLREVALDRLLPNERVRAHAAAASALEGDPDLAVGGRAGVHGQAAHHWWEARDLPRCLTASVAASAEAHRVGAFSEALDNFRRAIELWDQVDDAEERAGTTRFKFLTTGADFANDVGDPIARELAAEALHLAGEAGDATGRADAVGRLTMTLINQGREDEAFEISAAELALHGEQRTAARSFALSAHAYSVTRRPPKDPYRWEKETVGTLLDLAAAIARDCEDPAAEFRALSSNAQILGPYLPGRSEEPVRRMFELAEQLDDHAVFITHYVTTVLAWYWASDMDRTADALERWQQHATASGAGELNSVQWAASVALDTWLGRFGDVEARVDSVDVRDIKAAPVDASLPFIVAGDWLRWTGQAARALARAELAVATIAPVLPDSRDVAAEHAACLAATGATPDEVFAVTREAAESQTVGALGRPVSLLVSALATAARGLPVGDALLADVDGLVHDLETYRDELHDNAPLRAPTMLALQQTRAERAHLAGTPDPALWDPVVADLDQRSGIPHGAIARLRRATARAAADDGSSPACEADLLAAWDVFVDLGMTPLQDDTAALARRLRIDLPRQADPAVGGGPTLPDLTDREREVLALVAEGWTNKRVGQHLFISPKTVSVHMSNAMRKLEVDSRSEAVAVAHRAGLLADG